MARRKQEVVIPSTALVASAVRYPGASARIYQPNKKWQEEAYRHYGICGEARFAASFFGHALSRATIHVEGLVKGELARSTKGPGVESLNSLFNGADGQAQMLSAIGVHLTIAGECYLVGRSGPSVGEHETGIITDGSNDVWEIVSTLEMSVVGKKWTINYGDGTTPVPLTDDDVVIRIWRPHPARRIEADSPFRSLLPILSEVEWLTRHIFAQTSSRLAGAGILFLPQGMTFPAPPEVDGKPQQVANEAESFMLTLADGMLEPIEDPSSPSAMVPIVVTAPDDSIDKAKLMHFWSELDGKSLEMRNAAIHRFALGMDLPPEQVLGMSHNQGTGGGKSTGVSHWGAWQIEESTIKLHIEPMLELVCNALTIGYLRPAAETDEVVRYDTSELRLRPDRSQEAFELYDRGAISLKALLREVGFDVGDIMGDDEMKTWLLRKVASGSATPEQVGSALKALGVDLGPVNEPDAPTRESRPAPSLEDHPSRPRTPDAARLLLAACEPLVFRGMERAGNRLRNAGVRPPNTPAFETHVYVKAENPTYLLDDAWSCAQQVLDGIADHEQIVPILDSYCRTLLTEQAPHTRERLSEWLNLGVVSA